MRIFPLCLAVGLVLAATEARADLSFTLDASNISGYTTGNFGTITLTDGTGTGSGQNGIPVGTVQVSEALAPNVFAVTGAAYNLEFSLAGSPTISQTDITNLQFSGPDTPSTSTSYTLYNDPSLPNGSGYTGFGLAIDCSTCGSGTSAPVFNSLVFDITDAGGLASTDFTTNTIVKTTGGGTTSTSGNYYFLSDIGILLADGTSYSTGYATADTPTCTSCAGGGTGVPVPEPATATLLAVGLLGLVGARWHSRRA